MSGRGHGQRGPERRGRRALRAILPWLLAAGVILGAAWVRLSLRAEAALAAARATLAQEAAAVDASARRQALDDLRFAMGAWTPGAAAPEAAAELLWTVAQAAEARKVRAEALAALRRLRGGIRATRWLLSPFRSRAAAVDARLAALTAEEQLAQGDAGTLRGRDRARLEADHAALLALDPVPHPARSLWIVLSFCAWIAGAGLTIARGLDREARLRRRPFLRWAGFTLVALTSWLVALAG